MRGRPPRVERDRLVRRGRGRRAAGSCGRTWPGPYGAKRRRIAVPSCASYARDEPLGGDLRRGVEVARRQRVVLGQRRVAEPVDGAGRGVDEPRAPRAASVLEQTLRCRRVDGEERIRAVGERARSPARGGRRRRPREASASRAARRGRSRRARRPRRTAIRDRRARAATTSCPSAASAGIRCDATKPVAPVTRILTRACGSIDGVAQAVVERDRRLPAEQLASPSRCSRRAASCSTRTSGWYSTSTSAPTSSISVSAISRADASVPLPTLNSSPRDVRRHRGARSRRRRRRRGRSRRTGCRHR